MANFFIFGSTATSTTTTTATTIVGWLGKFIISLILKNINFNKNRLYCKIVFTTGHSQQNENASITLFNNHLPCRVQGGVEICGQIFP